MKPNSLSDAYLVDVLVSTIGKYVAKRSRNYVVLCRPKRTKKKNKQKNKNKNSNANVRRAEFRLWNVISKLLVLGLLCGRKFQPTAIPVQCPLNVHVEQCLEEYYRYSELSTSSTLEQFDYFSF
uniref:Uncharacterized protein n=1 Tax=Cacopsylla melanoneura TaxID=428564 RepID=A0A8D8XBQ6_9HEMI